MELLFLDFLLFPVLWLVTSFLFLARLSSHSVLSFLSDQDIQILCLCLSLYYIIALRNVYENACLRFYIWNLIQ